MLNEVHVMDIASRMELRHEERVHVPKFGLDQRSAHFLKAHAHEFRLDGVQKLSIRVLLSGPDPRRSKADRVFPEPFCSPASVLQEVGAELRYLFSHALFGQVLNRRYSGGRELEGAGHTLIDPERFFGIASLDRIVVNDVAIGFREALQFAWPLMNLLEQRS